MSKSDRWTLPPLDSFPGVIGPVVICILDGVGTGRGDKGDAVHLARTPNLDWLSMHAAASTLTAHGKAVGMPGDDDMGNSEVGHNALGAGRIFDQGAKLVAAAFEDDSIFEGHTGLIWKKLVKCVNESEEPFHFLGLLSDGNVHSHIDHLFAMLNRCDAEGVRSVRIHILLDGRDVPGQSALSYVDALEKMIKSINSKPERDYCIASGGGRMNVTMDRYEADWQIVKTGWEAHVHGKGRRFGSARQAIETLRAASPGINDQYLPAFVVTDSSGQPSGKIRDGASVVLFNFRGDRAIGISRAFEEDTFQAFDRNSRPMVEFAGMMEYDGDLKIPKQYLVNPPIIDRTLGEFLVCNKVTQLAISETQKFGHVTYFWNGNRSGVFDHKFEQYIEIPSDRIPFEKKPRMKAKEITDRLIEELLTNQYRHARVNYANGDMVGHTGHHQATIKAIETVDLQIGRLMPVIKKLRGALIVTADHGNAEEMFEIDRMTGEPRRTLDGGVQIRTSHSLNPVPFYVYTPGNNLRVTRFASELGLANVAATILYLLGLKAPEDYHQSAIEI